MRFGIHLPLIDFERSGFALDDLIALAKAAAGSGYATLAANDHLLFARPWLDGPTALAAVLSNTGTMTLATTVALPAVRGPGPLAKTLAALDLLSGGRLVAGIGPGSSPADYAATGLAFDDRWKRLDDAMLTLRALLDPSAAPHVGPFYSTEGVTLEPAPPRPVPIWLGSWGSEAGLRRVARLADGWLASAYNTTPELFAAGRSRLAGYLEQRGRDPSTFPNALATTFLHLAENDAEAERMLMGVVAPAMNRPPDQLRERILVCTPRQALERVGRWREAGLQQMLAWPVVDHVSQTEAFAAEVTRHFT